MKLVNLKASNVLNLKAIDISPKGNVLEITGNNGAGKSNAMNLLWMLLGGASAIPKRPIRDGEEEAVIVGDLGEIVVTRTFTRKDDGECTTKLSVESKEGGRYPSPQTMLDGLISRSAFDPMVFDRLPAKDQVAALRKFVTEFDFEANDRSRAAVFERRATANRQAKEARARASGVTVPPGAPDALVDEDALVKTLSEASSINSAIQRQIDARDRAEREILELDRRVTELEAEIERAKSRAIEARQQATAARNTLQTDPIPERVEIAEAESAVVRARNGNAAFRLKQERAKHDDEAERFETEANRLTAEIAALDTAKVEAVKATKFPVEGLSMTDEGVLLNGKPYQQASTAERIKATFAIAMSDNPKLRVARISDGSLLDRESFETVSAMAEWNDFLLLIETVEQRGPQAVLIVDGEQKDGESNG